MTHWTARAIADGTDGQTHLLWTRADGANAVWTVNDATGAITSTPLLGPIPGWNVSSLSVGPDNLTHSQWKRAADGMTSIWTVAVNGTFVATPGSGPFGPWTADALGEGGDCLLGEGGDSLSHLLWENGAGQFSVWTR